MPIGHEFTTMGREGKSTPVFCTLNLQFRCGGIRLARIKKEGSHEKL
ncbi:hypothetical protein D1BOALGB6SA_1431 [Olavius sp. associated proteobacterium Delta 1]|nr:hypothetical protein D1BOALGB6SA_1431 [Olavius sp. associated proteobacterium Delta 1]